MHERYSYYRNIAYISVIFGGYVLIWYSRGDGLFAVSSDMNFRDFVRTVGEMSGLPI